ncbi:MAG: sodium:solute symporter [Planctomycetaceae bacterium TMED240]|nr:sodium:solute symporter [Rhodopirellula sp.]OUX09122.1 MAG: sodium:solute symporter [Planctomycetaceae bacterium TMED240]
MHPPVVLSAPRLHSPAQTGDPTITLAPPDLIVLVTYVVVVIAFGCWFIRKSGTSDEFMAAGGSLPGWAVGMSIFGTYLSSNTFLGNPGKAYGGNFNAYLFTLSLPLAVWIAAKYFVPFYRKHGQISAYQHLEDRFGLWARTYAMLCYLLTQIARVGTIMFGVAIGLHALTDWDVTTIIMATGFLVTLYTLLGGIEAVIWTDVIQSIVLMGGALLIFGMLIFSMPEGPTQAWAIAKHAGKMELGSWDIDPTQSTVWVMLLFGLFINLTNFGIDQSFVQRYHTASSEQEAKRAVWLGAFMYVPISLLFFFIGAALFAYYETQPGLLDEVRQTVAAQNSVDMATLKAADIGDRVLPHFIATKLPPGLAGLLIAAIFAAAMSSIDTSLNSSATVILKDLYQRYCKPEVKEREAMYVLRIATIAIGFIGTMTALLLIGQKSILDAWWLLQGVFSGGMLGLFLLGIMTRHANAVSGLIAIMVGVSVIGWMTLSPKTDALPDMLRNPLHANLTIVVGTITIFLTGLLISRLANPVSAPSSNTELEKPLETKLKEPGEAGPE